MKLRNKITGKIVCARFCGITDIDDDDHLLKMWLRDDDNEYEYNSLAELNEEWEDYEEPEEDFWYIDSDCETYGVSRAFNQNDSDDVLFNKSIGNYFETKEEAEKTLEKLKAFKRLKDKGFSFVKYDTDDTEHCGVSTIYFIYDNEIDKKDLDFLFGGEE